MNKIILAPGIYVYKNVFNDTSGLIKNIEELFGSQYAPGGVYEGDINSNYNINTSTRNVDTFAMSDSAMPSYSEKQKNLYETIKTPMLECLFDYKKSFGISDKITDDCWMILRYGKNQKFDNHSDDGSRYPRLVSMTAYLNNNYDGGELEYENFGLSFKPEPGDVLIFPSNYVYKHRVVPVTSGLRYAVVNWFRWYTIPKDTVLGDISGVQY
jgi:hypothetical protein